LLAFIVNNDGGRVEEIASELQVSESSVLRMLNELGYRFVKGKWVPHDLSDSQRQKRVETAQNNLRLLNDNPRLLDEIIAIDETWLPNYLPLTDPQAGQWVGPGEEA
jgi:histone-lysine N-methyltransferase SETMAR